MPVAKKNTTRKRARKKASTVIVVTKTYVPMEEALFPENSQKIKEILSKAKFRTS